MTIQNKFLLTVLAIIASSTFFAEALIASPSNNPKLAEVTELGITMPIEKHVLSLNEDELERRNQITLKAKMSFPQTFMDQIERDPAFADTWVQHYPKPVIYITFAGEAGYKRGKALVDQFSTEFGGFWVDYVDIRKATISLVELKKLRGDIENVLRLNKIDFQTNEGHDANSLDAHINVEVLQTAKTVEDVLRKAGIKPSKYIKIIQIPAFPVSMATAVYGGFELAPARRAD